MSNQFSPICVIEHYDPNSNSYPPAITWRTTNLDFAINRAIVYLDTNPALLYVDINDGTYSYSIHKNKTQP